MQKEGRTWKRGHTHTHPLIAGSTSPQWKQLPRLQHDARVNSYLFFTVSKICPDSHRIPSQEVREVTRNGINYTCKAPVRKRMCKTGCMANDGRTKCCRTVDKEKLKDFICKPQSPGGAPFIEKFTVIEQRQCECYYCQDICPLVPASENSVEVEHTAATEGNSVVQMPSSAPDNEGNATTANEEEEQGNATTANDQGEMTTRGDGITTTKSEREMTTNSEEVEQDFTTPTIEFNSV